MKKLFSLLLVLSLFFSGSALASELLPGTGNATGYAFDLRFHLNADFFPEYEKDQAQGYADLLEIIELKGTIVFSPDCSCLELDASVIPVTNPASALPFKLSGLPTHLVLTSPLLGDEKIFFNNPAIPEFAQKTYYQMKLPLPYLTLMIPYCAQLAFSGIIAEWNQFITPSVLPADIPPAQFDLLADSLQRILDEDGVLRAWLSAFTMNDQYKMLFENELATMPYYLVNSLIGGRNTHVELSGDHENWSIEDKVFLSVARQDHLYSFRLQLPETESGYTPSLFFSNSGEDGGGCGKLSLMIGYNRNDNQDPSSLLSLALDTEYPVIWPVNEKTLYSGSIQQKGVLLPEIDLEATLEAETDGSFHFSIFQTGDNALETTELLSVSGSIVPVTAPPIPQYTMDWAVQYLNVFSINDQNIGTFFSSVAHSSFRGLLAFAVEVPASSFRSILDDLTDYRIISLLLGE